MQKDGLVRKTKDTSRKNRVLVQLTGKGYRAYLHSASFRSSRKAMSVLTAAERATLWDLLSRLRDDALGQLKISVDGSYPPSEKRRLRSFLRNLRDPGQPSLANNDARRRKSG